MNVDATTSIKNSWNDDILSISLTVTVFDRINVVNSAPQYTKVVDLDKGSNYHLGSDFQTRDIKVSTCGEFKIVTQYVYTDSRKLIFFDELYV